MATGGGGSVRQIENIFQLLESKDTANEIREVIKENLSTTKEIWLIHLLVDYYFQKQSPNIPEILAELRESQAKVLMEKLHDGVKTPETRLPALQLVLYLVYKDLPWCHKLVDMPLFIFVLRCLETETDIPILMTGVMIIVILLPSVPVSMGPHLQRIFDVFRRLATFCVKKPANSPEVFLLHLQVALYSLFQRLYGMYPCSFIEFISKFCSSKENILVYEEVMLPMLERVRLHPKLITGQHELETSLSRWKNQETHDIIVNCSKLSLDLIEGSWEDSHCPIFHTIQSVEKYRLRNQNFPYGEKAKVSSEVQNISKTVEDTCSIGSLYVPNLDASAVGESPSVLIGLSTPPVSQRATPASGFLELGVGIPTDTELTPRQLTPSHVEDGEKTPLSRSSSRGAFQQSKTVEAKRPSVMETKSSVIVPQMTPVTPGSQVPISPALSPFVAVDSASMRSKPSAFVTPIPLRSQAVRTLHFNSPMEEVNEACEADDSSLTTHETRSKNEGDPCREEATNVCSEHGKGVEEVATGLLPVDSLPHIVGDMHTPETDKLDQEVEAINEGVDHFDECASVTSSISTLASQTDLTAESVRQFMKKVNRIRFNSLTSNSSSDLDAVSITHGAPNHRSKRPNSCPPLKRQVLQGLPGGEPSMTPRTKPKLHMSAGDRMVSSRGLGRQMSMLEPRKHSDCMQKGDSSDDITSSSTGSSKDATARNKLKGDSQIEGNSRMEVIPPLPSSISSAFQCIFAPSKLAVCSSCLQQVVVTSDHPLVTGTTITGNEVSLFSLMSPPELLDRHLRLGSDIHAKELAKIPLTSKDSTNWTHFGGVPPADEVNILRGQIILIQNQLMYERHKRSNHAKRNRRLLRRITNVAMLEEQQKTLMDQVRLQEREIDQLRVSVQLLQEENRKLKLSQESDEYEKLIQFRTSLKENKDLKAASVVLKNLLLSQREEYDKQHKKLESVQHKNLENEKELEICKERLAITDKLSQRVFQLQKEVLLSQEFHQKCQEQLRQSRVSSGHKLEESYLINSLKSEIADLTRENKKKSNLLEAYQTRMIELEELLKSKETAMNDIKRNFEDAKSCHDEQLKAVEDRCQSMVHLNQQLEAKVMELICQLDQTTHRKMLEATKTPNGGGSNDGGSSGGGIAAPASSTKGFEYSKTCSAFSKSDFRLASAKSGGLKDGEKQTVKMNSLRTARKFASLDVSATLPGNVSVVMAKDEVSVASSTFTEISPEALHPEQIPPSVSQDGTDIDVMSDSGAASRTSYRADSDASIRSVSEHSLTTGDSGCWPKD